MSATSVTGESTAVLERCEQSPPVNRLPAYHHLHLQVAAAQAVEGDLTAKLRQAHQEVQEKAAQHAEATTKLQQELSQAQARAEELARQQETAASGWTQSTDKLAQLQQELDAAQAALAQGSGELSQARPYCLHCSMLVVVCWVQLDASCYPSCSSS